MRVCLFEDHPESLFPLTLTRPTFALRCGLSTLAEKQFRHFRATSRGAFVRPSLVEVLGEEEPDLVLNDGRWLGAAVAVLVNGRWLPPRQPAILDDRSCVGMVGEEAAFIRLSAEQLRFLPGPDVAAWLDHWKNTLPRVEAGGSLARYPWDLVEANGREILEDFKQGVFSEPSTVVSHLQLVGPREMLWVHPSARIDPLVVADTTGGPVVIDREAKIAAFTRLEGPCYVGAGSQVLGAKIRAGTSIGPDCRVGGEVEASILQGYVNKYHEGFLGHSYVGAWVNLAAGTHTSDLRCDYGEVAMTRDGQHVLTGQRKVGSFIGDHTRTGLGVLLNTGSSLGAFCQVLPTGGFAPRCLPSFTQYGGTGLVEGGSLGETYATAQVVRQRRGQVFGSAQRRLFDEVYETTGLERKQAMRSWEQRRLRRSA